MVSIVLTGTSTLESTLKLLGLCILFILIIIACYYVTRFVGTRQLGQMRSGNFKIIDMCRVSQNQCLQIVKAGKRYFLIAVCKDSITVLTELNEGDFTLPGENKADIRRFGEVFATMVKKNNHNNPESTGNGPDEENK